MQSRNTRITEHFSNTAPHLFRQAAGVLRHPFIVPGAQYGAELWDWDAYWTTLGLLELAQATGNDTLRTEAIRHGKGSILNFFEHQAESGAVPIMMRADNPDVFDCLCQPDGKRNHAKPVFAQFALALLNASAGATEQAEARAFITDILPAIERFHNRWESGYRHKQTGLLVWGSDVAIGVDNDPATYARPAFSSANLLLNGLYHADLEAFTELATAIGDNRRAADARARAEQIAAATRTHCWDTRDNFFYSLDTQCEDHRAQLIPWARPGAPLGWSALPVRIQMFTGFLPLWNGIASDEQAAMLLTHLANPETFCANWGVRSLSAKEPMYTLGISSNPSNWNGPVWILANYLIWQGLHRYGFTAEADQLADKTLGLLEADISRNNATHEYYAPDTGAPIMNKGFISWNLLACAMLNPVRTHLQSRA